MSLLSYATVECLKIDDVECEVDEWNVVEHYLECNGAVESEVKDVE